MSVIVEVRVEGETFELGRILQPPDDTRLVLDHLEGEVPGTLPVWAYGRRADAVTTTARVREPVEDLRSIGRFPGRNLYALEWDPEADQLLAGVGSVGGSLLRGEVDEGDWTLAVRFPSRDALSRFREHCGDHGIDVAVERRYDPDPAGRTDYGLTDRQRETLELAVDSGYYDIPRETTTQDLGEALGVSDQAVTERLRRGIGRLVDATLLDDTE